MSYEGYVQCLCKNGHYWDDPGEYSETSECPICKSTAKWWNSVDETNCDSYGFIDMSVFLIKKADEQVCNLGHTHYIDHDTYRIPTFEETKKARCYRPDYGETPLVPLDP